MKIHIDSTNTAQYVYEVNYVIFGNTPARPYVRIDANTEKILQKWNGLTFDAVGTGPGGNIKIGKYQYGVDYPKFNVTVDGNDCELLSDGVITVDANIKHLVMISPAQRTPTKRLTAHIAP
ncbi:MAG: PepSY domain-containing protein [Gammaproteobacteria bacterium]|nr:PepSY domain-containing protein [Gammaproteobacteria bacterium]